MVWLGVQTAFFFICLRNTAISYSVSFFHGAHLLPGFASAGGGASWASALLVEMPAIELCTLVPSTPAARDLPPVVLECLSRLSLRFLGVITSMPEPISESDESESRRIRPRPLGRGMAVFLCRSRGREVLAPWRPPSKVKRRWGARS